MIFRGWLQSGTPYLVDVVYEPNQAFLLLITIEGRQYRAPVQFERLQTTTGTGETHFLSLSRSEGDWFERGVLSLHEEDVSGFWFALATANKSGYLRDGSVRHHLLPVNANQPAQLHTITTPK